jgi:hypothetical protein
MNSQEAAWYLLRQPMLEANTYTVNIPTCWPHGHQKTQKTSKQMQEENVMDDLTDMWYDNIIQKYEKRPMESMANVTLADFAPEYTLNRNDEYKKRSASVSML